MTTEDLRSESLRLVTTINKIKTQIDVSRNPDPGWLQKAQYALRMRGIEHQQVLNELAERKRSHSEAFDRRFVEVARATLPPETFSNIARAAHESI